MRLKKNNVYIVRLVREGKKILEDLKILGEGFTFIHRYFTRTSEKEML